MFHLYLEIERVFRIISQNSEPEKREKNFYNRFTPKKSGNFKWMKI